MSATTAGRSAKPKTAISHPGWCVEAVLPFIDLSKVRAPGAVRGDHQGARTATAARTPGDRRWHTHAHRRPQPPRGVPTTEHDARYSDA